MKEMLKSKVMIAFMVFMIGVFYINACETKKLDEKTKKEEREMVVLNLQ